MSNEEFEFILAALDFIAIYGQRFLPLYHFNWKTGAWTSKRKEFNPTPLGKEKIGLPLDKRIMALNQENNEAEGPKIATFKNVGVISTYSSYLESARQIACLLPKFPSQRRIPDDIDINLPFRI